MTLPASCREQLHRQWEGFYVDPEPADYRLTARQLPGLFVANQDADPPSAVEGFDELIVVQTELFEARINLADCRGTINFKASTTDDEIDRRPAGIRGAVTALYSLLLPRHGGMLLHASGILQSDVGVGFVGPSGAGKSTLCGMFDGGSILNDDQVAITGCDTRPRIHATPFSGTLNDPRRRQGAPLVGLFAPHKSDVTRVSPWAQSEAFRNLMRCVTLCGGVASSERQLFRSVHALTASVPLRVLEFSREPEGVIEAMAAFLTEAVATASSAH